MSLVPSPSFQHHPHLVLTPGDTRTLPLCPSSLLQEGLGGRSEELADPCQALSSAHAQSDAANPPQVTSQVMAGALLMPPFHQRETGPRGVPQLSLGLEPTFAMIHLQILKGNAQESWP